MFPPIGRFLDVVSHGRRAGLALTIAFVTAWTACFAVAAEPTTRTVGDQPGVIIPLVTDPQLGGKVEDATLELRTNSDTGGKGPGFVVTTLKQPGNHYDIEVRQALSQGVKKGDVLFASFWARAKEGARYETGEAFTLFRIQRTASPWERALYREFAVGPEWTKVYLGSRFPADVPAEQLAAVFSAGYPQQTLEIAGMEVVNLGPDADVDALPVIESDYAGSAPDAAWRSEALERIEQLRKGDLSVRVIDGDGRPVPDATVRVEMTRHAFSWGVAISADWLAKNWETPTADVYRGKLKQTFNSIAIENALKWSWWERDPSVAMQTLKWAKSQGLAVHGHVLVWPGLQKFRVADAAEVWAAAQNDPQVLRDRINGHIVDILTRTAGYVGTWDVVNEAYNQNELLNLLGRDEFSAWFKLADQYAPDAVLLYNDFGLLGQQGTNHVKQQWVYDLLKEALAQGAPIDAIGFQSHLGGGYTPPARVLEILDRFAELGLDLQITEYDIATTDAELAERYTRDFLIAVFSHSNITAFQGWNYWAATPTWMPEASWFDERWRLMPIGKAYASLVLDEWWTRDQLSTNEQGVAKTRGFLGDYRVVVESEGLTHEASVTLNHDGTLTEIVLTK